MEELLFYSALIPFFVCLGRLRRQSSRFALWVSAAPQSEVDWEHPTPNFLRILLRDATADGDTSRASTTAWNQISGGLLHLVNTICRQHHLLWTLASWDSYQLTLNGIVDVRHREILYLCHWYLPITTSSLRFIWFELSKKSHGHTF